MSYFTNCAKCGKRIELPAFEGDGVFSRDYPHKCEIPVTNPTVENGCFVFRHKTWEDMRRVENANWANVNRIYGELLKRKEGR